MKNSKQSKKQINNIKTNSIASEAFSSMKMRHKGFSMPLCLFVFFTILSLGLGYLFVDSLILTVPFVIAPSFFAYFSTYTMPLENDNEIVAFFAMFKAYFSRMISGCFRIVIGFLKALLTFAISETVLISFFEIAFFEKNAEYSSLVENLNSSSTLLDSSDTLFAFLESNPTFKGLLFLVNAISIALATLMFLHHVAYSTPKLCFNLIKKQALPMREFAVIDKMVKKSNKRKFWKAYFSATWFIDVIILIGFVTATLLEYFIFNGANTVNVLCIGLVIDILLLLPLFNYLSELFIVIFMRFSKEYERTIATFTLDILKKFQTKLGIDDKKADEIKTRMEKKKDEIYKDKEDKEDKNK